MLRASSRAARSRSCTFRLLFALLQYWRGEGEERRHRFDVAPDGVIYASTGREIVKIDGSKSDRVVEMEDVTEGVVLG